MKLEIPGIAILKEGEVTYLVDRGLLRTMIQGE